MSMAWGQDGGAGDVVMMSVCWEVRLPHSARHSVPIKWSATMMIINILKIGIGFHFCLHHQSCRVKEANICKERKKTGRACSCSRSGTVQAQCSGARDKPFLPNIPPGRSQAS